MTRALVGRARMERNRRILAASDVCHVCGQPGADAVDHVIPLARGGSDDPSNLRPVHHDVEPLCNRLKGDREWAPVIRRSSSLRH